MPPTAFTPSVTVASTAGRPATTVLRRKVVALLPTALLGLVLAALLAANGPAAPSAPSGPSTSLVAYRWTKNISDNFHRVVRPGFGRAHIGGRYHRYGRGWLAVNRRHGQVGPIAPGKSMDIVLPGVHSRNEIAMARFAVPRLAHHGYGTFVSVMLRHASDGSAYLARLRVGVHGLLRVSIAKSINGQEQYLTGEVPLGHVRAGRTVLVEGFVTGEANPHVGVRAWLGGHRVPQWQHMIVDNNAGPLATSSGIGIRVYQSTGSADGTVFIRGFYGWRGVPVAVNPDPSTSASSTSADPSTSASSTSADPSTSASSTSADPSTSASSTSADPSTSASSTSADPSTSASSTSASSTSAAPSSSTTTSSPPPSTTGTAGAADLGTAQYNVPGNAVYVATDGSDGSGNGSLAAPFATLSRAISAAPAGGTVVLRGGSYNQYAFVGKAVTIEGYPGEAVWLDGSVPVNGWTQSGSTWVHSGWNYRFDHSASFSSGSDAGGFVNPAYPLAAYPDQVFANGAQLQQVSGQPGPGQFSVNYSNSTITIGSDPSGVAVRASNLQQALVVGAGNVTLRGLGVRNYATSMPQMGTVYFGGSAGNDVVRDVVFRDNATQALSLDVANVTVDHVTSSANGMTGIHANGADGLRIENSLLSGNNTQHFNPAPSAAAIKVSRLDGVTVANCEIVDNLGVNGIWTDENVTNFVLTGNHVADNNAEYGIITELSDTGIVAGNSISGTKYGYTAFDTGNVKVFNNTFSANRVWDIGLSQDNRYQPGMSTAGVNPTSADPWIVDHVTVANNDMSASSALYEFYALDKQTHRAADSMHISLAGNLFRPRVGSGPWSIGWGGSDNTTVANYASPRDYEVAKSLPVLNGVAASDMSSVLVSLPSDVANALGVATGTEHLGAF